MILKTLYEILGVPADADDAQIKRAYRRLVKRMHPDKGGDPEKFREVTNAYEVLSDPERRKRYDETGFGGDAKKVDAAQKDAVILSGIILQAMQQNPQGCNPVQVSRDILKFKIESLKKAAAMDNEMVVRIRLIAANVTKSGEGDNIIEAVLKSHANGAEAHARATLEEAENLTRVLRILDEYGWKPDSQRGEPMFDQLYQQGYGGWRVLTP